MAEPHLIDFWFENDDCKGSRVGGVPPFRLTTVLPSLIVNSNTSHSVGDGLFQSSNDVVVCGRTIVLYTGQLIDQYSIPYINPAYIVEYELGTGGFKLKGDAYGGHNGLRINGTHPSLPHLTANARFNFAGKFRDPSVHPKLPLAAGQRVYIPIVATEGELMPFISSSPPPGLSFWNRNPDIAFGVEIILPYAESYWRTMERYAEFGPPTKPQHVIERDARASRYRL